MTGPDGAVVVCRFLFNSAVLLLWGSAAYLRVLVPPDLRWQIWERLLTIRVISTVLIALATAATLPARAAEIGDGWRDAVDPSVLWDVAFATTVGTAWLWQAAFAFAVLFAGFLPVRSRLSAILLLSALLVGGMALTGHAVIDDGLRRTFHQLNDVLHVLAGGAWFGALLPVLMIVGRLNDPSTRSDARTALVRFSTAGHLAVALVIATGLTNTLLILGGLPMDWAVEYQELLAIKIALVAVMTLVALTNRYIVVPAIARHHDTRLLAAGTVTEIAIGVVVIALVALFGTLPPT